MTSIIEVFLKKMGLQDEPHMIEKTTELVRLLDLRSINMPLQVNEYGKVAICADIATSILDIPFDKEHAIKLSAMRKSQYTNNKRTFEKLLDLNKIVGVNDICVQLSLSEVSQKAKELLELYKRVAHNENNDVNITHPQYAAMAVFYACKLTKRKFSKTKLMPYSNLKPTQWLQLEQRWERTMAAHYKDTMDNKLVKCRLTEMEAIEIERQKLEKELEDSKPKKAVHEDYEIWKQRMLAMANEKLKEMQQEDVKDATSEPDLANEKENFILGL